MAGLGYPGGSPIPTLLLLLLSAGAVDTNTPGERDSDLM